MAQKIYSDEEMQHRVSELSVEMQTAFIRASEQLFNQESNIFLSIIQESRNELMSGSHGDNESLSSDIQKQLFMKRKMNAMGLTKVNYKSESQKEKEAVEKYLRAVGRQKHESDTFYARPVSASSPRPAQAYRMKIKDIESNEPQRSKTSLSFSGRTETPVVDLCDPVIHKEKEILMKALTNQDEIASSERQRQAEILEQRKKEKAKKKKQNKDVASDLIAQSGGLDDVINKNKEKQDQMLKERLEKKMRQRQKTIESLKLQSISQDGSDNEEAARRRSIRLASMTTDDIEAVQKMRKKSVSNRDLSGEPIDECEDKPKKKKKKHRSKSQQPAPSEETSKNVDHTQLFITNETLDNFADEQPKKKKKKKRKNREVEEMAKENEMADSAV